MGRNIIFAEGEFYHVYHRGNDKRDVFHETIDYIRFLEGLLEFNTTEVIGSLYLQSRRKSKGEEIKGEKLVDILAYNILPNHFHIVLRLKKKEGLSRYMKSQLGGYTNYYNEKYKHQGPIFAGPYKCKHIASQEYLDYVLRYVHFNHLVHKFRNQVPKFVWNSWSEMQREVERQLIVDWSPTCIREQAKQYEKESLSVINELVLKREAQKTLRNKEDLVSLLLE